MSFIIYNRATGKKDKNMTAHYDWKQFLQQEMDKPYYKNLVSFLKEELKNKTIFPKNENWFNALSISPEKIKVIIIGQDPYHGDNQAHGYSFSVQRGVRIPPSLSNIYQEIENEYGYKMSTKNGDLTPWAEQGVMLLNAVLTVEKSKPASHQGKGWEIFTDEIIKQLSNNFEHKVFMLWGAFAQGKKELVDTTKHLVLTSPHPSPFSVHRGFFGNGHFAKANAYLKEHNQSEIDWKITD